MHNLVVFLGNPGTQYKNTRHNAGWLFAESLSVSGFWQEKFHSLFLKDGDSIYIKPLTYINESGRAVQEVSSFFGIKPQDILVVHDDIEKKTGDVLFEKGGALRGHNGLRSIAQMTGSQDFCRLRIGVGRPDKQDVASYVLSRFTEEESAVLENSFKKAEKEILQPFLCGRR